MNVVEEILSFCRDRDAWQQDVVRRLFSQSQFGEGDLQETLATIRTQYGLPVDSVVPSPIPVSSADVPDRPADAPPVIVNSVGHLVNTNRLATGQVLPFGIEGLTVVYGDNGSGKSGYCRILKKLCRVREGGQEDVRGDAFQASAAAAKAEATVRFTVGNGEPVETRWKSGTQPPAELSRISVFDAKAAALYADQQNRIEFLPYGLDVLMRMGEVLEKLGSLLEAERAKIDQRVRIPLPMVGAGTPGADLVGRLNRATPAQDLPSKAAIEAACSWTEADELALGTLERALLEDPEAVAAQCRKLAKTVEMIERDLRLAGAKLDDEALGRHTVAWENAKEARDAATLAATQAQTPELLAGFGGNAWRLLFQYAKEYSAVAYPGETFPITRDGARCVLCQQDLDARTIARFKTFDRYVRSAAEAQAIRAEKERDALSAGVAGLALRLPAEVQASLATVVGEDPGAEDVAVRVATYLMALAERKGQIQAAHLSGAWGSVLRPLESPEVEVAAVRMRLLEKAAKHEALRNREAKAALEAKATELRVRRTLSSSLPAILQRRDDLDTLSRLKHCKAACDTSAISRKNSELRKQYLTKDFQDRLFEEIRQLDLAYIPFKVQEKSDHGASFLGVGLETPIQVKNHDVLSDGEFRALAIACFLTEVGSITGHNGIIIDDPVSSLDHLRTRVVAERLVREAKQRQVIVFTHDLVFYHELSDAAAEEGVPLVRHWIRRTEELGFGTIAGNEAPWQAKPVNQRLDGLARRLATIRKMDVGSGDSYRAAAKDFYTDLRETWERLVEELLLNGTVGRLQPGVKTQSIGGVGVTDEDYKRVFFGMKRASVFSGHDRAQGAQVAPPKPDEMQRDMENLKSYADDLRKRNRKLEEERRKLEKAPAGITV